MSTLDGLDPSEVDATAAEVRDCLRRSTTAAVVYTPGNATRYDLVFAPGWMLDEGVLPGWDELDDVVLVSHVNGGRCYAFKLDGEVAPGYVAEKLGLGGGDAAAIAALFAAIASRSF